VVKVIWHKAASPPQTSGKIVFAIVNLPSHKGMLVPPGKYYWICASFGPTRVHRLTANRLVQPFCTAHGRGLSDTVLSPNNCPFAWGIWAPSNNASLGTPKSITQMASRSVQPFLNRWLQCPYILQWAALPPSKLPLPMGMLTPSNTWFLGPTKVLNPNGISIAAIFAGLTTVSTRSVTVGRIYVRSIAMQPNNKHICLVDL